MNIHFDSLSPFFFKETILPSLTAQQKTILLVAAAVFGFLAVCYAACRCYLMAAPLNKPNNDLFADKPNNDLFADEEKDSLKQQMAQARQADSLSALNGWRKGLGHDEKEQTLEDFKTASKTQLNVHRTHLKIVVFGETSVRDRETLAIVCDYLQAIHALNTTLDTNPLDLDNAYIRHYPHRQYAVETQLTKLQNLLPINTFFLGFTDQDLYPYHYADRINFIFGVASTEMACGLFSTQRLRTTSFDETLRRLMKLASHEFSHMRGIDHCTQYVCNMEGSNSLQESDRAPLTFCSQDMAKICYLNQWSLKEGYENQLSFFENFSQRYGHRMDFSKEIAHLKRKIEKIDSMNLIE